MTYLLMHVNWWAVSAATLIAYVLGALWYGPLFGKAWLRETGQDPEKLGSPGKALGITFFLTLGTAVVLAMTVEGFDIIFWPNGVILGFGLSLGLYAFNLCSDFLFEGRSTKLLIIQCGYRVICATLMAGLLSAWR